MRKSMQLIMMLAIVALVAALASYLSARVFGPLRPHAVNNHEWIHKQLDLTQDEQKALEPVEQKFQEQKVKAVEAIRLANKELADAIRQDQTDSPGVAAAVEKIHRAQGELQKATLEHVFEMKRVLTPQHYQKLLILTTDELNQVNGGD
jgi:Spy/CpxP family protein refolding chaperone